MTAAAQGHSFGEVVVDVAYPGVSQRSRPVCWLSPEEKAAELQRIQAEWGAGRPGGRGDPRLRRRPPR